MVVLQLNFPYYGFPWEIMYITPMLRTSSELAEQSRSSWRCSWRRPALLTNPRGTGHRGGSWFRPGVSRVFGGQMGPSCVFFLWGLLRCGNSDLCKQRTVNRAKADEGGVVKLDPTRSNISQHDSSCNHGHPPNERHGWFSFIEAAHHVTRSLTT